LNKLLWLLPLCLSCGQPLVASEFSGTPVFTVGGAVNSSSARVPANHGPLELSVFWVGARAQGSLQVEQSAQLDSGLGAFSMTLFDPPSVEASGFSDLVLSGQLALGVIVLYADKDSSGGLELSQDLLLGASARHVVVHTTEPISADAPAADLVGAIEPGYHLFYLEGPAGCRFVDAAECPSEGLLVPAPDLGAVSLSLWATPQEVLVPAPGRPATEPEGSIWVTP